MFVKLLCVTTVMLLPLESFAQCLNLLPQSNPQRATVGVQMTSMDTSGEVTYTMASLGFEIVRSIDRGPVVAVWSTVSPSQDPPVVFSDRYVLDPKGIPTRQAFDITRPDITRMVFSAADVSQVTLVDEARQNAKIVFPMTCDTLGIGHALVGNKYYLFHFNMTLPIQ